MSPSPLYWQKFTFKEGEHDDVKHKDQLPFKHIKNLTKGASIIVEKVQNTCSAEFYALKSIYIPLSEGRSVKTGTEKTKVAFRTEVHLIRKVTHDHVVRRFCGRQRSIIKERGKKDPVVEFMECVLERALRCLTNGLAFIHHTGIRHKNIKPENILIHKDYVLYINSDCSLDVGQSSLSVSDGRGGFTAKYHPPEGLRFEGRNQFSDVYSLGCVVLEIPSNLNRASFLCPEATDNSA